MLTGGVVYTTTSRVSVSVDFYIRSFITLRRRTVYMLCSETDGEKNIKKENTKIAVTSRRYVKLLGAEH